MAGTNTGQLTSDLSGLGGAISATIKQSLNAIQNSLNSLANKPAAAPYDISGLREQIIENADILFPMIYTDSDFVPDMKIVTFGSGTAITAGVVYDNSDECTVFIESGDALSAGQALEQLLDVTQRMLKKRWSDDVYSPYGTVWRSYGANGGYHHYEGTGSES